MASIQVRDVVKQFGDVTVVDRLNLDIEDGEFVVLVGASGCGKSTTLRMIAGLENPTRGRIRIGDRDVTEMPPAGRDIAMVFQNYALYPHMSVAENMSFSLRLRHAAQEEIDYRVNEAARILNIDHLLQRKPKELSGGQRQRVAMGRAIVREPEVFLFDEPLSNLDAQLRGHMRVELARLHERLRKTVIYVTHDQVEAMTLATRIVVFDKGRIQQIGTPDEVFNRPQNRFVAGFIGSPTMNFFDAQLMEEHGRLSFVGKGFSFDVPPALMPQLGARRHTGVVLGLRPQAFFVAQGENGGGARIDLRVDVAEYLGTETVLVCSNEAGAHEEVSICLPGNHAKRAHERVSFGFELSSLHVFDGESGDSLSAHI